MSHNNSPLTTPLWEYGSGPFCKICVFHPNVNPFTILIQLIKSLHGQRRYIDWKLYLMLMEWQWQCWCMSHKKYNWQFYIINKSTHKWIKLNLVEIIFHGVLQTKMVTTTSTSFDVNQQLIQSPSHIMIALLVLLLEVSNIRVLSSS